MLTSSLDCGGAETHVISLAIALSKRGHSISVASSGGRLVRDLEDHKIEHIRLPLNSKDPVRLAFARNRLDSLCGEGELDVIHAHSRIPAFLASPIAKKHRVAFVTTVHARFRVDPLLRRISRWGTLSIAVSEDLKQYLAEEYGIFPDNIFVVPNGIDTEYFSPSGSKTDREDFRITFVSRMDKDCSLGAKLLCDIAPSLCRSIPNLRITLCGGGDGYKAIKKTAMQINRQLGRNCVEALGYVDNMVEILRRTDLFVGVSRAALEAMATEVPTVLCGDEGFWGEVTEKNFGVARAGNFCCRGEPRANGNMLADEILRIYKMDESARNERGRNLRRLVCEMNENQRNAVAAENIYRSATERALATRGKIVLCGFYGFGNLGDECLLFEAVRRCRRSFGDTEISALTLGGKRDEERFGVRCVKRTDPFAVFEEIKRAELFVFGGGTLLQDISSRRSLIYYAALLRYAQKMGVRCELWGNGIGRPLSQRSEELMARTLGRCSYVGLRDSQSVKLASELCGKYCQRVPRIAYEKDLAMELRGTSSARTELLIKSCFPQGSGRFAVVTVNGRMGKGFLKLLSEQICELKHRGLDVILVPMFPKEDMRLTKRIAKELGGQVISVLSGRDLVGIMAKSEVVLGMRLHSLIFAFLAGVTFIGFGEDPKIEAFCRENGGYYYTDLYR